ncbi:MAG: hypothetical protein KKF44_01815 [Nanoarchaeota archaeon]|nr:hypothetical protein [Nanoarchaeota archaeon]
MKLRFIILHFHLNRSGRTTWQALGHNPQIIVSNETSVNDEWLCEVTPNDGYDDGTTKNATAVTILPGPTAPTWVDYPVISPASPTKLQNLTCNFNVTDAEGDPITNITNWYKNNVSTTVLYMPFEGGSNSTYTKDYSGYNNNGVVYNAQWNRTGGKIGGAYYFDGTDDHINGTDENIDELTGTLMTWVKFDDATTVVDDSYIFFAANGRLALRFETTGDYIEFEHDGSDCLKTWISYPVSWTAGSWHHLAAVWNATNNLARLFIDGNLTNETTLEVCSGGFTTEYFIGTRYDMENDLKGYVDELKVYDAVLSNDQIHQIYLSENSSLNGNLLISGETALNEDWLCSVTPNDGYDDGLTKNSSSVTISSGNSAPTFEDNPVITPSLPGTLNNLTCNYNVTDADNDNVTNITIWYKNNVSTTVLYLPFEGGSNSTYTKDYSGFGNDGVVTNATWNRTLGRVGGMYEFDGSRDYINGTNDYINELTGTLEFWIKPALDSSSMSDTYFFEYSGRRILIRFESTGDYIQFQHDGSSCGSSTLNYAISWSADEWHHIAGIWNASNNLQRLYIDGVMTNETTSQQVCSGFTLTDYWIGMRDDMVNSFNGAVDEVKVYNITLTSEQIWVDYQAELYGHSPNILVSNETSRDEAWHCEVTPNDGYSDGTSKNSSSVIIQNSIPTHDAPAISPTNPSETNNLTCNWNNVTDADGDSVVNITNWYKNNVSTTVLYMPFEGGSNSTYTKDYSGYGHIGSVEGPTWNRTGGIFGGAYEFGTDQRIEVPHSDVFNSTQELSFEFWAWHSTSQVDANGLVLGIYDQYGIYSSLSDGRYYIIFATLEGWKYVYCQTNSIVNDTWQHIVFTIKSEDHSCYVDGNENATDTDSYTALNITSNFVNIGTWYWLGNDFIGRLDEIKFYNYTLSAEQVLANYQAGLYGNNPNILASDETNASEEWHCEVTPNDGYADGITKNSSSVTITALPEVSSVVISPTIANTTDTLFCNATVSDTENSTLTVEYWWYNNSVLFISGNRTGVSADTDTLISTVTASNTTFNETWNCTIRAFDGTYYSSGFNSAAITIRNSPPTHDTPTITPSDPNVTSNLTCNWQNVADANNHNVVNITNWYMNNVSNTALFLPFEGNGDEEAIVREYSGSGISGTVYGATWNRTGGKIGGAYEFGADERLEIPHIDSFNITQELSIEFWAWHSSAQIDDNGLVVGIFDQYRIYAQEANQRYYMIIADTENWNTVYCQTNSIVNNTWQHIVFTIKSGDQSCYVDGNENATDTDSYTALNITSNVLNIGNWDWLTSDYIGKLDEIKFYNYTLSAEQVLANYQAGLSGNNPNILVSDETSASETWLCSVTPNDGYDDGITKNSSSVTIAGIPEVTSIAISPASANITDNLNCNATVTDSENATLTVEYWWYNNSVLFISGNKTGVSKDTDTVISTITSANTTFDETWNCTIRAFDGTYYSSGFNSAAITIRNSPPTHDTPTITPSDPNITSNLTCNWNNVADAEGHNVANITVWYKNNVSNTALYLPFEGNGDEEAIVREYSGSGINGTVYGATWNRTGGKIGGAYEFGADERLEIPHTDTFNITQELSFEFWAWHSSAQIDDNGLVVGIYDQYRIYANEADGRYYIIFATLEGWKYVYCQTNSIVNNTWQHIAFTLKSGDHSCYVDGNENATDTDSYTALNITSNVLNIGNWPSLTSDYIGRLDEIKIFNYTLSPEQIFVDYQAGLAGINSQLLVSNETSLNEQWLCSVTPNDGYADGLTKNSTAVTIENAAPSVSSVSLSPESPHLSDNLNCNATVTDLENTTLTVEYYWYNNSVLWFWGNKTGLAADVNTVISTLGYLNTTTGETWNCTVRAYDGTDYSDYSSTNATIQPTGPPYYSNNLTNSTLAGSSILHSLQWDDPIGLSGYIFQFCNGTWNGTDCLGTGESGSGATPITNIDVVDIAPVATGTWQSVDVSSYVPIGAEGICIEAQSATTTEYNFGIRMGGSTDNRVGILEDKSHQFTCIGINSTRQLEIYIGDAALHVYLYGYIPDGYGEFIANAVDKSTDTTGAYVPVDISGDFSGGTCAVAFYEFDVGVGADSVIGTRIGGRTNTPHGTSNNGDYQIGMMGLNSSEIFEQYISSTLADLWVHGCLYAGDGVHIVTDQDPIDYSTETTGTWVGTTITDSQSDDATGIFFGLYSSVDSELYHQLRKNSTWADFGIDSDVSDVREGWIQVNSTQGIEQKIEANTRDLYVWGWTYATSETGTSDGWVNDTWVAMGGLTNSSNVTKSINSTVGLNYSWCVHANNTQNLWNSSSCDSPFTYTSTEAINTPPTITTISISPTTANTTVDLNCNATATDSEESTVTVEYWWYNNSVLWLWGNKTGVAADVNTVISTLGYLNTTTGETWNCTVRAYDGTDYSGGFNSTTITIQNSVPAMKSSTITPIIVYTNNTLLGYCNATDADYDNVSYDAIWYKNDKIYEEVIPEYISAGGSHTCGILTNGSAYCWGMGDVGQLGYGGTDDQYTPYAVNSSLPFKKISAGETSTCGLLTNSSVYCWGYNYWGILGTGDEINRLNPTPVNTSIAFSSITTGVKHACGISSEGYAYCWGCAVEDEECIGGLGDGSTIQQKNPVAVNLSVQFIQVSAGGRHTCGIIVNGSAVCWGSGALGQLGYGGTSQQNNPVFVNSNYTFKSISAGDSHTCGILANGSAMCWGSGVYGQLGYGGTSQQNNPIFINLSYTFQTVSSFSIHSCGILMNGSAMCWGSGIYGQLGYGGTSQQNNSILVNSTSEFKSISAGSFHTCSILTNGSAVCWGKGEYGRLGYGGTAQQNNTIAVNTTHTMWPFYTQGSQTNAANITYGLSYGQDWTLSCRASDNTEYSSWLNSSTLTIQNWLPSVINVSLSPESSTLSDNLDCNATVTDLENTTLSVEYFWYNNSVLWSWGNKTGVTAGTNTVIDTISSSFTSTQEEWNCTVRAFDGTDYSDYSSDSYNFTNALPSKVNLSYPAEGDAFFTNRTPEFRWENATDDDSDFITYHLELSLNSDLSSPLMNVSAIDANSTIYGGELELAEYFWRVRANDSVGYGEWSDVWNFTLAPELSIKLNTAFIEFGLLEVDSISDTDDGFSPFIIENDGNIIANITRISVNASIWESVGLNTSYFQFKADNDSTEVGSFNWTESAFNWTNMTQINDTNLTAISYLDWHDSYDTAEIDIRLHVPPQEPPGAKTVTVHLIGANS